MSPCAALGAVGKAVGTRSTITFSTPRSQFRLLSVIESCRRQEALAAQQQQHIISGQFSAAAASSAVADSNNSNSSNSSFGASGQQQAPPPLRGAGENRSPQYVAALEKEIGDLRSSLSSSNSRGEEIVRQANAKCTELDSRATAAEAAVASHQAEITRLREEGEKVLGENRLLKRAVAIQSQRLSALESKVAEQEQSLSAAADAVRRLETENYALKHHLRQAEDALRGRFSGGPGSGAGFGDGVA